MVHGFPTLFFNISGGEMLVILLIVFIVFGPGKIPEIARSLGRMMNEVKKASSDISREFRKETDIISRDLKKTTDEITREAGALAEDPLESRPRRKITHEETIIPDAYLEADKNKTSEPVNDENPDEKSEKQTQ